MAVSEPEHATVRSTDYFAEDMRSKAVAEFGSDGAWLLLSQLWYGWRVHFDLACALAAGSPPGKGNDPRPDGVGAEYAIVRDLQIQATLYAAAEQFATLVRAMRKHQGGTDRFFDAFVRAPTNLAQIIEDLDGIDLQELKKLVGDPSDWVHPTQSDGLPDLDPKALDVTEVGGILVPTAVFERRAEGRLREEALSLLELVLTNVEQLSQFVVRPDPVHGTRPQSLRAIDNSFRHGLRVLFHQAVPEDRNFRVAAGEPGQGSAYSVDLYLPGRGSASSDSINFGSVYCAPERTVEHLTALRELCTRTGQVARAFLGFNVAGDSRMLVSATSLSLPDPPAPNSDLLPD